MNKNIKVTVSNKELILELKKDFIIPKGTKFWGAPIETKRYGNHWQADIEMSRDSTMNICMDEDVFDERPDLFREI